MTTVYGKKSANYWSKQISAQKKRSDKANFASKKESPERVKELVELKKARPMTSGFDRPPKGPSNGTRRLL
jgi:hypothetical protein